LASIPAAVIGLLFKAEVAKLFSSPTTVCYLLVVTGTILAVTEVVARILKNQPTKTDAFIIGCAQSLALLPGISRSGATIAAGMACGLSRKNAAQFSFLLSIPVMVGASSIAFFEVMSDVDLLDRLAVPIALGFLSALVSGYLVIKWFMAFLAQQRLLWFSAYCVVAGFCGVMYFSS
jgi:undecaprenyl-diphosphatase